MPSNNKTPNIGLNRWQGNEYVKRQDFVEDNNIIDKEIGDLKDSIKNLKLVDTSIDLTDHDNLFNGAKNVNEAIISNKTSIIEIQKELVANKSTLEANITAIREVL